MKILQGICLLCAPLALDAACGSIPCSPQNNTACSVSCVSVTLPDTTALYENNAAVIGTTAPTQTINFGTIQTNQSNTQTFNFTVGTFNPGGNVTIAATDSSGQTNFVLTNTATSSSTIGFNVQYKDCSGVTSNIANRNTLTLLPSQSSMVITSGFPSGTAPCRPYVSGLTPGSGVGQLIFTIPAATPGNQPAGGIYTDTVNLLVTADN